jgi:hypothetical protein
MNEALRLHLKIKQFVLSQNNILQYFVLRDNIAAKLGSLPKISNLI